MLTLCINLEGPSIRITDFRRFLYPVSSHCTNCDRKMRKLVLTLVFIACIAYGYCRSFLAEDNARSAERVRQNLFAR